MIIDEIKVVWSKTHSCRDQPRVNRNQQVRWCAVNHESRTVHIILLQPNLVGAAPVSPAVSSILSGCINKMPLQFPQTRRGSLNEHLHSIPITQLAELVY